MAHFPKLSIATKLYAIFALLATATVVLALVAAAAARRHETLTDDFEAAYLGAQNVERINSLIYAVVMESRGVYMSEDAPTRRKYAEGLLAFKPPHQRDRRRVGDHHPARAGGAVQAVRRTCPAVHLVPE